MAGLRRHAPEAGRVLLFASVGLVNTGVDFALFLLLTAGGVLPPLMANVVSFGAGACCSYLLNGSVTFRQDGRAVQLRSWRRVSRFAAVTAVCLAVSTLVLVAGMTLAPPLAAKVAATAATLVVGYTLNRLLVFAGS